MFHSSVTDTPDVSVVSYQMVEIEVKRTSEKSTKFNKLFRPSKGRKFSQKSKIRPFDGRKILLYLIFIKPTLETWRKVIWRNYLCKTYGIRSHID